MRQPIPPNGEYPHGKPILFNEKSVYLPLVLVIGIMGSLAVGVYNVSQYIAIQKGNETRSLERYTGISVALKNIAERQDLTQKELTDIKVDLSEIRKNDWNITDMLLWCRETEAINKGFKCPATVGRITSRKTKE